MNAPDPAPRPPYADAAHEICLANARLVLRDRVVHGLLTAVGGSIAAIKETAAIPAGAVDCGGDLLIPGLVELHTDNLERHIEPRPGVHWPHAPAIIAHDGEMAAAGVTTVFDAMRIGSIPSGGSQTKRYARDLSREVLALRAAGALKISHFLHLRAELCSETLAEELAEFHTDDRVGIVSLMDHTPGQRQFRDMAKLKTYVMGKRRMSELEFVDHVARLKDLRARHGDAHERHVVAEARRLGAVLASHDDTTAAQVVTSAAHGIGLAEFPTTQEAAEACRASGLAIMMGAPNIIRGSSHSNNVSARALAEAGLLDILSSDYVPSALLLAAFRLADLWDDLPRAIRCVSEAPARAAGLTDRGTLNAGQRADMVWLSEVAGNPVIRGVWSGSARVG